LLSQIENRLGIFPSEVLFESQQSLKFYFSFQINVRKRNGNESTFSEIEIINFFEADSSLEYQFTGVSHQIYYSIESKYFSFGRQVCENKSLN
jgi:predicted solute-binding protein